MNPDKPIVFIVDDDRRSRLPPATPHLGRAGAEVFDTAQAFLLTTRRADVPSCLVLDVRLPGLSGLDLQRELAAADISLPIVFLTGYGDIPMSVRAMRPAPSSS
jgi:FixJ family two-component response regulator